MGNREKFPILRDDQIKWVPWKMLLRHEACALRNHYQSLDELARRGGLSVSECLAVMEDRLWRDMPDKDARRELLEHVEAAKQGVVR